MSFILNGNYEGRSNRWVLLRNWNHLDILAYWNLRSLNDGSSDLSNYLGIDINFDDWKRNWSDGYFDFANNFDIGDDWDSGFFNDCHWNLLSNSSGGFSNEHKLRSSCQGGYTDRLNVFDFNFRELSSNGSHSCIDLSVDLADGLDRVRSGSSNSTRWSVGNNGYWFDFLGNLDILNNLNCMGKTVVESDYSFGYSFNFVHQSNQRSVLVLLNDCVHGVYSDQSSVSLSDNLNSLLQFDVCLDCSLEIMLSNQNLRNNWCNSYKWNRDLMLINHYYLIGININNCCGLDGGSVLA